MSKIETGDFVLVTWENITLRGTVTDIHEGSYTVLLTDGRTVKCPIEYLAIDPDGDSDTTQYGNYPLHMFDFFVD